MGLTLSLPYGAMLTHLDCAWAEPVTWRPLQESALFALNKEASGMPGSRGKAPVCNGEPCVGVGFALP